MEVLFLWFISTISKHELLLVFKYVNIELKHEF